MVIGGNMKALISSLEPRETGYRVAQLEKDEDIFPVADGLFWVDCADDLDKDRMWYDPQDQSFKPLPTHIFAAVGVANQPQPISQGAQTL